jgi:hypothetical protein
MSFELYVPAKLRKNKSKRSNSIGLSTKGKISIYRQIVDQYFQGKQFAKLYYDKKEKLIGIEPTSTEDQTTLKLQGNNAKFLTAKKFFNTYEIEVKENLNLPFEWNQDANMLVLKVG